MDRGNSPRLWYYFDPCRTCTAIRSSQVGCVHGGVDRPRVRPACRRPYGRPAPAGLTGRGARQVLRREGHGRAADVWSLGFERQAVPRPRRLRKNARRLFVLLLGTFSPGAAARKSRAPAPRNQTPSLPPLEAQPRREKWIHGQVEWKEMALSLHRN